MLYAFVTRFRHETSGIARAHTALLAVALAIVTV